MTGNRTPADVLLEARKKDSLTKRSRVLAVIDEMKARDEPITFLGVARAARVSNWLVYAEGVREHVEAARKGQAGRKAREQRAGITGLTSERDAALDEIAGLRTALRQMTRQQNTLR